MLSSGTGRRRVTPLGAVARGLAAGLAGTAVMTVYQTMVRRAEQSLGSGGSDGADGGGKDEDWEHAPAPAKVAYRLVDGLFHRRMSSDKIPLVSGLMHWSYGTAWGALYGLTEGTFDFAAVPHGIAFGTAVWASAYVQMVPLGIYKPPWEYSAKTMAEDVSYHLVYGIAVAAAYEMLRAEPESASLQMQRSRSEPSRPTSRPDGIVDTPPAGLQRPY